MRSWAADFETINDRNDCRVWAWSAVPVSNWNSPCIRGTEIDSFMHFLRECSGQTVYFHNSKFDGSFIMNWLFRNGYTHTTNRKLETGQFSTLITDMGVFYTMSIKMDGMSASVKIVDSLKLITCRIDEMPNAFGFADEMEKLSIDYNAERKPGYQPTADEWEYVDHDVKILARGLEHFFKNGLVKMTAASCAMHDYKNRIGNNRFKYWFPVDNESDAFIRNAYYGGAVQVNPKYAEKIVEGGRVYDVNSHFPAQLRYQKMPYGKPVKFNGKYIENTKYPLYVQHLTFECELKPNHIPTLPAHRGFLHADGSFVEDSDGEELEYTLTNVDLGLLFEHYEVWNITYIDGYMFRAQTGMFDEYIDYWMGVKQQATIEKNKAMRTIAKLFLNSLYGKFGSNPVHRRKIPVFQPDGSVKYELDESLTEYGDCVYVALAAFTTAYARAITLRSAQSNYDRFIYCDTDSLHLAGMDEPEGLEIDHVKLGAWDNEYNFVRGYYIHAKCYFDEKMDDNEIINIIKCAGMTDKQKECVTFDTFRRGLSVGGKLKPVNAPGGIVLEETTFQIK